MPASGGGGTGEHRRITAERKKFALDDANRSGGYARTLQWLSYGAAAMFFVGLSQLGGGRSRLQVLSFDWGLVVALAALVIAVASDRLGARAWAPGVRVQARVNWAGVILGGALVALLSVALLEALTSSDSRLLFVAVLLGSFGVGLVLWLLLIEAASLRALRREASRHRRY